MSHLFSKTSNRSPTLSSILWRRAPTVSITPIFGLFLHSSRTHLLVTLRYFANKSPTFIPPSCALRIKSPSLLCHFPLLASTLCVNSFTGLSQLARRGWSPFIFTLKRCVCAIFVSLILFSLPSVVVSVSMREKL